MLLYLFLTDLPQIDAPEAQWSLHLSVVPLPLTEDHLPCGAQRLSCGQSPDEVLANGLSFLREAGRNVTGWRDFQASMTYLPGPLPEFPREAGEGVYEVSDVLGEGIWKEVRAESRRRAKAAAQPSFTIEGSDGYVITASDGKVATGKLRRRPRVVAPDSTDQ